MTSQPGAHHDALECGIQPLSGPSDAGGDGTTDGALSRSSSAIQRLLSRGARLGEELRNDFVKNCRYRLFERRYSRHRAGGVSTDSWPCSTGSDRAQGTTIADPAQSRLPTVLGLEL